MEFKLKYYPEKWNQVDLNNPEFVRDRINVVNPEGYSGIVTLWSRPENIWRKLLERFPRLFEDKSPLVTLTSLYGNGLPQMLVNLAHNPQIEFLAVTGSDKGSVPSSKYLLNFLEKGVNLEEGSQLGRVAGTSFPIDPQLQPDMFEHLKVERFKPSDLEGVVNFVTQEKTTRKASRREIDLIEPEFSDFPSDVTSHQVLAQTPLEAWMEVIYLLDRYGENIPLKKGERRALFNLNVHVQNPEPEDEALLKKFGFDPEELKIYRENILKGELPEDESYNYGNRMREYFGTDTLRDVIERFKLDPLDRRGFISLWDTKEDLTFRGESDSSVPCLTNLYFVNLNGSLMLTANFRTHNATSAWLSNLYGLRAIQEYIAGEVEMEPGKMNIKSGWIGIDPNDARTNSALEVVKDNRKIKIDVNDPRGYFVIGAREGKIFAEHYSPEASLLTTYTGNHARDIKDQLRQGAIVSNPDHAMWIANELAKAHYELHGEIPEL